MEGSKTFWLKLAGRLPLDRKLLVLQGKERSLRLNFQLAGSLAFVAGALNAGGFLAFRLYTSHITGSLSRSVDELVLGNADPAWAAFKLVLAFFAGAFFSATVTSLGKRRRLKSRFAVSLLIQAGLLTLFGLGADHLAAEGGPYLTAMAVFLSFVMGMQNSVVTSISNAEVRTTHMTGIVTDLGIETSRLLYVNRSTRKKAGAILANRGKLKLHGLILSAFICGAFAGAWGFKQAGFKTALLLALLLTALAFRPLVHDLQIRYRLIRRSRA